MTPPAPEPSENAAEFEKKQAQGIYVPRIMGQYGSETTGPTLICIAGIHGNEPTGIWAIQRVLNQLQHNLPRFLGRFFAIAGNIEALSKGQRYIDTDLNRVWTPAHIKQLEQKQQPDDVHEYNEQLDLYQHLHDIFETSHGPVYVLDLHTSSSPSTPFGIVGASPANRHFSLRFPIPLLLGMEQHVSGALLEYVGKLGHYTLGFEAGQHDDPASVDLHEALLWTALHQADMLDPPPHDAADHLKLLSDAGQGYPSVLEVFHRQAITNEHQFVMKPGFSNFALVEKNALLAHDKDGEILAPRQCRVLLPLYQKKGADGFFLAQPISPNRLKLSFYLDKIKPSRVLGWFFDQPKTPKPSRST